MILKIAHVGHPVLRERAAEVSRDELSSAKIQTFIDDLVETMRDAAGAGLAAPQVHVPLRICAIEVKDNPRYPYKPRIPLTVLVNLRGVVARFTEIEVEALDRDGEPWKRTIRGLTAGTFQHECDHLDGRLFLDGVHDPKTLTTWAEFDRYHKQAFVERATALVARFGS